jgi:uncharacterized SAM-binding protein YcdF (DUF218 family)
MIKKTVCYIFGLVLICWVAGFWYFGWTINHFQPNPTEHTDAIVVLTGGRNRIAEAVRLLDVGLADKLFISGVGKDISLKNIAKSQKFHVVHQDLVELGHEALNTSENADETTEWARKNTISSIRLVTSNYHILRSQLEIQHLAPQLHIVPHPVYSEKIEKKWWTSRQTFSLIFKEYNKFLCAYIRTKLY